MTQLTAHAKWILSGEHSVILGYPAIVFPVPGLTLSLRTKPADVFSIQTNSPMYLNELKHIINILKEKLTVTHEPLTETLSFYNRIPIGQGLGFSGALCSLLAQWACQKKWINHDQIFSTAKTLEHHFHGQSSGIDIVGSLATKGTVFEKNQQATIPNQQFHLYLSYSGQKSQTHVCVERVNTYRKHYDTSNSIDRIMETATTLGVQAFNNNSIEALTECIVLGHSCFSKWGLINTQTSQHIELLKQSGAIACKPTGSGLGGHVLSLWKAPPTNMSFPLFPALP